MFSLDKNKEGVTLIEVMVVLVILGVLAAISVPVYSNYVRKAKVNEAISNIGAIANAMRIYRMEKGAWPTYSTDAIANLKVNVAQYYFAIAWADAANSGVTITATAASTFDETGSIVYAINSNYQGTWSGNLVTAYADYLTH